MTSDSRDAPTSIQTRLDTTRMTMGALEAKVYHLTDFETRDEVRHRTEFDGHHVTGRAMVWRVRGATDHAAQAAFNAVPP